MNIIHLSLVVSMPAVLDEPEVGLTPAQQVAFAQDGFLIVPQLCPEAFWTRMRAVTLEHLQHHVGPVEYEAELHYPGAPENCESEGGRTIRRLKQAHSRDYVFTAWLQSPVLRSPLQQLLGREFLCPLAHHNCIMTKEPRYSSDTGWHQDIRYWSFTRPDLVNVWVALGPERKENGCLQLIPGTHRRTYQREQFDEQLFFRTDHPDNQELLSQAVLAELNPGDVLFFHARALHAATRNYSQQTKLSAVFTFRAVDNPPLPGSRSAAAPELLFH